MICSARGVECECDKLGCVAHGWRFDVGSRVTVTKECQYKGMDAVVIDRYRPEAFRMTARVYGVKLDGVSFAVYFRGDELERKEQ